MKEFSKRLIHTLIVVVSTMLGMGGIVYLFIFLDGLSERTISILRWIVITPFSIGALFVAIIFINWLFIEPFRKSKEN